MGKFLRGFNEEDLEHLFGDHVEVTVELAADGVACKTDEYSHD